MYPDRTTIWKRNSARILEALTQLVVNEGGTIRDTSTNPCAATFYLNDVYYRYRIVGDDIVFPCYFHKVATLGELYGRTIEASTDSKKWLCRSHTDDWSCPQNDIVAAAREILRYLESAPWSHKIDFTYS